MVGVLAAKHIGLIEVVDIAPAIRRIDPVGAVSGTVVVMGFEPCASQGIAVF